MAVQGEISRLEEIKRDSRRVDQARDKLQGTEAGPTEAQPILRRQEGDDVLKELDGKVGSCREDAGSLRRDGIEN